MCKSLGSSKLQIGEMKVKAVSDWPRQDPPFPYRGRERTAGPSRQRRMSSARRSKSVHVGTRKMVNYA